MQSVARAEAWAVRILGVLLILLGLVLFLSPQVPYTRRNRVAVGPSSEVISRETRVLVMPRPAAAAIGAAGVILLVMARRS